MNRTVLLTALMSLATSTIFASPAQTQAPKNPAAGTVSKINVDTRPEILGLWGMAIPGNKKCVEYYNFRGGNEVVINSGKEWSIGVYDYQPAPDNTMTKLPTLAIQVKYENNEKDCSGFKEDQAGELSQVFVRWENSNSIDFCADEKGDRCFVSLHRIRP